MTDQLGGKAASPPPTVTLLLRPEWGGRARHKDLEIPQPRWVCMVCLCVCVCVCVCVCSVVSNSLWAPQAPLSMRFSRQEYWSGLPCPPPAHLSGPGIKPALLHLLHWQADSLPLNHLGSPDRNAIVVSSLSCVWVFATPWTAACQDSLPITISRSLLKLVSIESVMPTNHLILCHPLLLMASIFLSIRIFSNELALPIRWPKYWSFSMSPSNEYSRLISFRIDWFDLLAVQETLKSPPPPQFRGINSSVLSLFYGPILTSTWLLEKINFKVNPTYLKCHFNVQLTFYNYFLFFNMRVSKSSVTFYTYSMSQSKPAAFQVHNAYLCQVATILDGSSLKPQSRVVCCPGMLSSWRKIGQNWLSIKFTGVWFHSLGPTSVVLQKNISYWLEYSRITGTPVWL